MQTLIVMIVDKLGQPTQFEGQLSPIFLFSKSEISLILCIC